MIDAHCHFVDLNWVGGSDWPDKQSPHCATYLPHQHKSEFSTYGCIGAIAIETSPLTIGDIRLKELAKNDYILGFVANLQPTQAGFSDRLKSFSTHPKFKGIRLRPIKNIDLNSSEIYDALMLLSDIKAVVEVGVVSLQLITKMLKLAYLFPNISFVFTHMAHGNMSTNNTINEHFVTLKSARSLSNVYIKLSPPAAIDLYAANTDSLVRLEKHVDNLFKIVEQDRLLYGSNWPVSAPTKQSQYFLDWLMGLLIVRNCEPNKIFGETAKVLYQL